MTSLMKKTSFAVTVFAIVFAACTPPKPVPSGGIGPNGLPTNPLDSCTVTAAQFNSWFVDTAGAKENGAVKPANSVTFSPNNNCSFYQWSEQMFLWITSEASRYGGNKTVMESPVFFTVAADTNNVDSQARILIPHTNNTILTALGSINQAGPHKLPLFVDKTGKLFEIEPTNMVNGKPMVMSGGKAVAIDHIETAANGAHTFFAAKNAVLEKPQAITKHRGNITTIVQRFKTKEGKAVLVDKDGNVIDGESGQATKDVLMAQKGSLVYYIIFVNDVYAYYNTGVHLNQLPGLSDTFPTRANQLQQICNYARNKYQKTLPDSIALTMELKTSWVETKDLPGDVEKDYVTIDAMIPVYTATSDTSWAISGQRKARLAMLGMHVVGSAAGHPEMIWATFEHMKNAPNARYQYMDMNNKMDTIVQDTGSNWILSSNASDPNYNPQKQKWEGNFIVSLVHSSSMLPSNTLRTMPWGSAWDSVTNQQDLSSAASNSEILSINNDVYNLLPGKDKRKNYWLIGATWTFGGAPPNGQVYSSTNTTPGVAIGTNVLANSTMETYIQGPTFSCFTCHNQGNSLNPDSLSHIFQYIDTVGTPLIKAPASMKK